MRYAMKMGEKMESYYVELGKMLRALRKWRGYRQETVAQMLGIGRSTYSDFERAKVRPQIVDLLRLAAIYQIPPEVFLYPTNYQSFAAVRNLMQKDTENK